MSSSTSSNSSSSAPSSPNNRLGSIADPHYHNGALLIKEENERVENEEKEIREIYNKKHMEFHKKPNVTRMREGSILNLERKGIVKEISQKFQTPDTASYTRPSTAVRTISIKERIIQQKKDKEKQKVDIETNRREKVIILNNDNPNNNDLSVSVNQLIEKMSKPIDDHYHHNNKSASSSPITNSSAPNKLKSSLDINTASAAAAANGHINGWKKKNDHHQQQQQQSPRSSPLSSSPLGRKRRGRNELVAPSKALNHEKNLQLYLSIQPNPPTPPKITKPHQIIHKDAKLFLEQLINVNSKENQDFNLVLSSPSSSSNQSSISTTDNSKTNTSLESQLFNTTSLRLKALKMPFKVLFLLPNQTSKTLMCKGSDTIESLKEKLVSEYLNSYYNLEENNSKQKHGADSYLILDFNNTPIEKSVSLNKCEYIMNKRVNGLIPKLKLIEKAQIIEADPVGELSAQEYEIIKQLIPNSDWKGDEVEYFRRVTARLRYGVINEIKGSIQSTLQVRLSPLPIPTVSGKIFVSVFLPITQVTKTMEIEQNETADGILNRIYQKNYAKHLPNVKPSDFILKVIGCSEYIHGPYDLRTFEYIRTQIIQGTKTLLAMIQRPKIELDPPPFKPRFDFPPELPIDYEVSSYSSKIKHWDDLTHISIRDIKKPLRFKVVGAYNIPSSYLKDVGNISLIVSIALFHGVDCIGKASTSILSPAPYSLFTPQPNVGPTSLSVDWNEQICFSGLEYCNIPKDTRVCLSLYASSSSNTNSNGAVSNNDTTTGTTNNNDGTTTPDIVNVKKDFPIGWVNLTLCDYKFELRNGPIQLSLWPDDVANPLGTCTCNPSLSAVSLHLEFEEFSLPVVFPSRNLKTPIVEPPAVINPTDVKNFFESIISLDPLSDLPRSKYQQLWSLRHYAIQYPQVLPRLMLSVPWTQHAAVDEIHMLIDKWPRLKPYDALELLDAKHADRNVREYAVSCLEDLPEEELLDILLQLVQVLKYEPYHDSSLARFLLKKAILNRNIGHSFFWYLKSDLHVPNISERFGILLEAYLFSCGTHRIELLKQMQVIDNLTEVAKKIKPLKDQDRREFMLKELEIIDWPKRFHLTLNPRYESNGLIFTKCKYMDSKKLPLRLSFTNTDMSADTIEVIFKVGDDLRQDMLTLQMIRLMDKLWQKEGLDLKLSPYGCIATGDMVGMIEVVLNSETTAKIQKNAGGATAAFKLDPLANWLNQHNKSELEYQKAVDTFILSCAGYCVATYVLGIGDRHNDNLMCTKLGRLFHIDFGHFLGNYKKKFGFKRERAPFVFTPDFCYVMGGKDSPKFFQFVNYCCTAYNILRKNAKLFMNLFAMMVSTGIPELQSMEDLNYLRESFSLELTDEKAREKFQALIYESLATKTTQFNNAIHILAH
eukprot:gene2582-3199_t